MERGEASDRGGESNGGPRSADNSLKRGIDKIERDCFPRRRWMFSGFKVRVLGGKARGRREKKIVLRARSG